MTNIFTNYNKDSEQYDFQNNTRTVISFSIVFLKVNLKSKNQRLVIITK